MKKNILLYMAAVAVLAGCNKGPAAPEVPGEIRVKASIGELTKVSYDGEKSAFAAQDTISVYAWMDSAAEVPAKKVVDGVVNTFDGQVWTPRVQMLWKTVVDPHYFLGIAPARYVNDFKADPFEQDPLDYAASDLLIATSLNGVKASDGLVSLAFDHAMAKIQVNLNFRSQWSEQWGALPAQEDVKVLVKAKTVGTVDYLAKEITASAQAQAGDLPMAALAAPAKDYTYSYSNLIIPQGGVVQITVIVGETAFVYNHADKKGLSLESGKLTTVNLIVGREQLDMETISVDDWIEGAMPATDGEAEEEEGGVVGPSPDPATVLPGVFSVSAVKTVQFSKGNLRYASGAWGFFAHQYDYYTTYSADAWDKFGWSNSTNDFGKSTSTNNNDYKNDLVDWGTVPGIGSGWRTPTLAEWQYLFSTRSASTVNSVANARYAKGKVNNVYGIILFPDTYTHPDGVTNPVGINDTGNTGWNGNNYNATDWGKMEAAGCVFLPAAGYRSGTSVSGSGSSCSYRSSTRYSPTLVQYIYFESSLLNLETHNFGSYGQCVRLVKDAN